jgi:hypothetical protein
MYAQSLSSGFSVSSVTPSEEKTMNCRIVYFVVESTMMKLACTLRGEFKIPVTMVHETTCGLSFQLTKEGIDDGIEDGCQIESFDNNKQQICQMGNCSL